MNFLTLSTAAINLTGRTIGKWTVLGAVRRERFPAGGEHVYWLCRCSCGNEREVNGASLRKNGASTSCGCTQRQLAQAVGLANIRHGMKNTSEWQAWSSMRSRCLSSSHKQFPSYGGRGIIICERWAIFENFFSDMGLKPSSLHSIDRIDNDGNYEPGNCRWATKKEQQRNRRANRLVTAFGKTAPLIVFFDKHGPKSRQYRKALFELDKGTPDEKAVIMGLSR